MANPERCNAARCAPADLIGPLNEVEQRHAPEWLHVTGRPELLLGGRRVAVVGSRKASDAGLARAARLARVLVEHGVVVVSGLAQGIDTAAHRSAIECGGATIAVLGTPLDRCHPPSNRELQAVIGRDHLLVSQFAPGTAVLRHHFVLRNRTMALVSDVSVIVEAGEGSGALSQGWEALRLRRSLFLLRSVVENAALQWPRQMIEYGAEVLSEPEELLAALPSESIRPAVDAPF